MKQKLTNLQVIQSTLRLAHHTTPVVGGLHMKIKKCINTGFTFSGREATEKLNLFLEQFSLIFTRIFCRHKKLKYISLRRFLIWIWHFLYSFHQKFNYEKSTAIKARKLSTYWKLDRNIIKSIKQQSESYEVTHWNPV